MYRKATFAAGCFWGTEDAYRRLEGVLQTTAGYTGGEVNRPTYKEVGSGRTGHVEAVELLYDPQKISFQELLEVFWSIHNPTAGGRSDGPYQSPYRSVIYFHTPEQEAEAHKSKLRLQDSGRFIQSITTRIQPAGPFYPAEPYHQQYYEKLRQRATSAR